MSTQKWDNHLQTLQVQKKVADVVELEKEHHSWRKIMRNGLTIGQLSFLLKAGSDTLPTLLNLRRMRIQHGSKCPLCNSAWPNTAHILNGCLAALTQGRYTWRHDSVLMKISQLLQSLLPHSATLNSDLEGLRAESNPPSTIPPSILSTALRPDMVIIGANVDFGTNNSHQFYLGYTSG